MFELRSLRSWKAPLALAGMGAVGFALGAWNAAPTPAVAQTPSGPVKPVAAIGSSDYKERVVAYIHGDLPITREELGEYLIARHGYAKVELLVNRRIIEHACAQRGIKVTDAEVETAINDDYTKPMGIDRDTFVKSYLKQNGKTLYEWKEDVVRPGLMMKKLCEGEVKVTEDDLKKAFDAKFGEKVVCRLIIWPENEFRNAQRMWDGLRKSEAEFATAASQQGIASLASVGGRIDPIGHGVADNDLVEKIAFRLQKVEVSELFPIPNQGFAVLKCDGRLPPPEGVTFEKKRAELEKFVLEQKVAKAVPGVFKKLRDEAKPLILVPYGTNNPNVVRTNEEEQKILKGDDKPIVPLPMPNK